jgi:hypothetical protein
MKKQVAITISILSLFVMLSVSASNVSAFPGCPSCKPLIQYAPTASARIFRPAPAQDTTAADAQPVGGVSFDALFWVQLAMFYAQLP